MRELFNDNWLFSKTAPDAEPTGFRPVQIPHDWLIYNANDLYENSYGHYRKKFDFGNIEGRCIRLYFEGVYMDCSIYINDVHAFDWKYGYTSFEADITEFLHNGENEIYVLVRHLSPNSRWYSGAGIFRDIWLIDSPSSHLVTDGVYFHAEKQADSWNCTISAETKNADNAQVRFTLKNKEKVLFSETYPAQKLTSSKFTLSGLTENDIWDIASPNLLTLETVLLKDGAEIDSICQKTGIRDIKYTTDNGFFLNGKNIKLNGVCLHHDLGCLGAAFNKSAARRQLRSMLDMGVNAVRTSHNPPAIGFMELCDEMGMLVDSEAFDMWERPKTEYDYARFFDDWYEKDVASWVRRDRNCPSVIMWSVGNEIYDAHVSPRGCEVIKLLHSAVRKHDPLDNAPTTHGSNYMPWEGAQRCSEEVDIVGYNYGESLYEEHHKIYPEWKIYGSETTSGVKSRGVYHFPADAAFLTHDDLQCSSLGNCRSGISADMPQKIIRINRDCDYCAGMFIWTGSDYIGEPSPYSTKNAYYGSIDTAGLRKDSFYLYKSAWGNEPVLHIMPYWDFNDGQMIDIIAYTNLKEAELFLNGRSLGKKNAVDYTVAWKAPYEKGEIRVCGYTESGEKLEAAEHSFGDSSKIILDCAKDTVFADGEDIAVIEISTVDADGYAVKNARDRVKIQVEGGRLVGFDNGDSTDYESYKSAERKLFSGKAAAYVAPDKNVGQIIVKATSDGIEGAELTINKIQCAIRNGICCNENITEVTDHGSKPVRKIELVRSTSYELSPECAESVITAKIYPEDAGYGELVWSVVTNSGISSNIASVDVSGNKAILTASGDGNFRLRCSCSNGKPQPEVISEYEFTASGFGQATFDPYTFLPSCHYTYSLSVMDEVSKGGVNIKANNNIVGFTKTDFGKYGTDSFLIRVINWHKDDPFKFRLWTGKPNESGSECLGEFTYQANFIWQTYQDNHYTLSKKLTGIQDIYFEFDKTDMRIDFGGFLFTPKLKAYEKLAAADCSLIHGDSYEISGEAVLNIGNNVFIDFDDMDFANGISKVNITGRTHHDNDSIHLHLADETGIVYKDIIEFPHSDDCITISKEIPSFSGNMTVKLQFLPGCDFDLESIEFTAENK